MKSDDMRIEQALNVAYKVFIETQLAQYMPRDHTFDLAVDYVFVTSARAVVLALIFGFRFARALRVAENRKNN